METRRATREDLPRIMEIYRTAQDYMILAGNPTQWGRSFPPEDLIQQDIQSGTCHLVVEEQTIHGVFALCEGEEPTYREIHDGAWLNEAPYVTIHRVASDGAAHGIFHAAVEYARGQAENVRIDTHENNLTMQRLIEKHGFVRCGTIFVRDGSPRIAYQWSKGKQHVITERELGYEEELLENLSIEEIQQMYLDEVLLWIRGSGSTSARPMGSYFAVLEYHGTRKYLEAAIPGVTVYDAILIGVKEAVAMLKKPVRIHIIAPLDIFFRSVGFGNAKSAYKGRIQEILQSLKDRDCQLSFSRADKETLKQWIMSFSEHDVVPRQLQYKRVIYRECLQKVLDLLRAESVNQEILDRISEIQPE